MTKLPVIFRAERSGPDKGDITAVFPTRDEGEGLMLCYSHIGQHSSCSLGWYYSTRPAKPHEYEPLLRELRDIYEDPNCAPDRETLVVYKRRPHLIPPRASPLHHPSLRPYCRVAMGDFLLSLFP